MDLKFWTQALEEAERELDAARTRTALDAAAKKLMRAKEALKRLEAEAAGRLPDQRCGGTRGAGLAGPVLCSASPER